ncbi:hypothetical protein BD310DRAFT_825975 [Dichomitus squalens]|uniref:Uncharacterized protein n=1 Tax=Dichomitus squalens TaxID=114155 RepID=A0A4Q9PM98_9APHY|nr:hypothetical protein BD310DRAFT_825975 [Dichomitus squalens]
MTSNTHGQPALHIRTMTIGASVRSRAAGSLAWRTPSFPQTTSESTVMPAFRASTPRRAPTTHCALPGLRCAHPPAHSGANSTTAGAAKPSTGTD